MPKYAPTRVARPPLTRQMVKTIISPEFSVSGAIQMQAAVASQAWHAANDPVAFPFRLSEGAIVDQLGTFNGTSAGGGFDIGIYSAAWVRLVATGSQTGSGNSLWQWIDVTNTALPPNVTLYLVLVRDNITANRQRAVGAGSNTTGMALLGTQDTTTDAFPLPDPLTNMAAATVVTNAPLVGMALRAPF